MSNRILILASLMAFAAPALANPVAPVGTASSRSLAGIAPGTALQPTLVQDRDAAIRWQGAPRPTPIAAPVPLPPPVWLLGVLR